MVDDARLLTQTPERAWGGPRTPTWRKDGKRAVILVPAEVYEVVLDGAYMTRAAVRDFNLQVYCAGLERLFGVSFSLLFQDYTYDPALRPSRSQRPEGHDAVRALLGRSFVFDSPDED